jgi:2-dehydropantoate 2-reductase
MKICVFGAGAVGGSLAAYMDRAGLDVTLIARGATLDVVRNKGLILRREDEEFLARPKVTDDTKNVGVQDLVVTALKVPAVRGALESIQPLIGPETIVIPAHNGVPWWHFYKLPGDWPKQHLGCVDPGGLVWKGLGPERTLGTVLGIGASVLEPGIVLRVGSASRGAGRFPIGEPDGSESARAHRVSEVLQAAGFASEVSTEIRSEVWFKILGNVGTNPISILTQGTMGEIYDDDSVAELVSGMMRECYMITEKLGINLRGTPEERIEFFRQLSGDFRTSTLQDFDKGRPVEIDAIIGAVAEIGRMVGIETPLIDAVYGLARLRATTAGCYTGP